MPMTTSPLDTLSVKDMAPYTNAADSVFLPEQKTIFLRPVFREVLGIRIRMFLGTRTGSISQRYGTDPDPTPNPSFSDPS
jgi:hypothetical protein